MAYQLNQMESDIEDLTDDDYSIVHKPNSNQAFRLKSFDDYPVDGIVEPKNFPKLAAAGFYFIGEENLIRCYSCSLSFTQATLQGDDDLTLPKWHRKKCELLAERNKEPDTAIRVIKGRGSIGGAPSLHDSGYDTPFLRSSSLPCTLSSNKRGLTGALMNGESSFRDALLKKLTTEPTPNLNIIQAEKSTHKKITTENTELINSNFVYTNDPVEKKKIRKSGGSYHDSLDEDSSLDSFESISPYAHLRTKRSHITQSKGESEYDASAEDESDEAISKQSSSEDDLVIESLLKTFVLPLSSAFNSSADEDNPAPFESEGFKFAPEISRSQFWDFKRMNLKEEANRIKTFHSWPSSHLNLVKDLTVGGFFYLGNDLHVQCRFCEQVIDSWNTDDNVMEKHSTASPHCEIVLQWKNKIATPSASNENNSVTSTDPEANLPEGSLQAANLQVVAKAPANPHMRRTRARLETFDNRWYRQHVEVQAKRIAKAGFFYLGEKDIVKCFYCNGNLQNWASNDDPWIRHAKQYPTCSFVIERQGITLVRAAKPKAILRPLPAAGMSSESNECNGENASPLIRFPVSDQRSDHSHDDDEVVEDAHSDDGQVKSAPSKTIAKTKNLASCRSCEEKITDQHPKCALCHENPVNVVAIPCKHLVLCLHCSSVATSCPRCKMEILNIFEINL